MSCKDCGLHIHSHPTQIMGVGNPSAEIMIINSYANDLDESNGKATIPDSLKQILSDHIDLNKVYYTNAIKCRAPKGYKYKVTEIKKCQRHLQVEIEKVKPKYILLIGAQAVKATIGGSITTLNGVTVEKGEISYVPTYSPGIVYRDPGKQPFVEQAINNFILLTQGLKRELPQLNIKVLTCEKEIDEAFSNPNFTAFSYDIETTGLDRFSDTITLYGFGNDRVQYIIPLECKFSPLKGLKLRQKRLANYATHLLNNKLKNRVAGNGKFDNLFLEKHFGLKPEITFDVVLGSHILNENTPNGVKENAIVECNALDWDIDLKLKKGDIKTKQDYERYLTYLGYDIYYEYKLYRIFKKKIREDNALTKLFFNLYMPVIRAYESIEKKGVFVYPQQFNKVKQKLENQLQEIENKLDKYKKGVNWASSKQVSTVLYGDLKLPVVEVTKEGSPSTSESTLLRLKGKHPVVDLILQHRGVSIQISHFITGWKNRMKGKRLHPSFKMLTVTGRTSCTDPNLQQVPRDPIIRNLIGAPKGRVFIEADFSQAELRIATLLSGDPEMTRVYQTGGDIHTNTYEMISHESLSTDKYEAKEQRKKAKAVNFGFVYGMGATKFKEYARDSYGVNLTDKEAQQYRDRFFKTYYKLPEWHSRQRRIVKAMGQVRNPIGRIRRLPDIYSSEKSKQAEAERQSINSPVQGFGSDLTLLGMAEVMGYASLYHKDLILDFNKFDCVGTVHDAILFEVDEDYVYEFIPKAKKIIEHPKVLKDIFHFESHIPIVVDISIGRNWGSGIELKEDKWEQQVKDFLKGEK